MIAKASRVQPKSLAVSFVLHDTLFLQNQPDGLFHILTDSLGPLVRGSLEDPRSHEDRVPQGTRNQVGSRVVANHVDLLRRAQGLLSPRSHLSGGLSILRVLKVPVLGDLRNEKRKRKRKRKERKRKKKWPKRKSIRKFVLPPALTTTN